MADGELTQERSTRERSTQNGNVSYEQWALEFFAEAINEERVLDAVRTIAGQQIEFGPVSAGPGGIATVKAYGEIKQPSATLIPGEHVSPPRPAPHRAHLRGRPPGRAAVRG